MSHNKMVFLALLGFVCCCAHRVPPQFGSAPLLSLSLKKKKKEFGTDVAAVESVWFTDNLFSLGQCLLMFVLQSREQYLLEYHMALFIFT